LIERKERWARKMAGKIRAHHGESSTGLSFVCNYQPKRAQRRVLTTINCFVIERWTLGVE
jgi:hypothetical protein